MSQACPTCGGFAGTASGTTVPSRLCTCRPGSMVGWRCPVCGAGNSPWSARCGCRPVPASVITCTVTVQELIDGADDVVRRGYRDLVLMQ